MKIAILGYGKEGQSVETYFRAQNPDNDITILSDFTKEDLEARDFSAFDLVFRSPSVHPIGQWTSITKYFFDHCPCPIIGVTGTKGKGTTSSIITAILQTLGKIVHLVGNIGTPALDILNSIKPDDVVVYEMSSFQLWDLEKSPHIAVVLHIEPDHLNVHTSYDDYISAKANIAKHQTAQDYCIYNQNNADSARIAQQSFAKKLAYPFQNAKVTQLLENLSIPGQHNQENAQAALLAVAACYNTSVDELIDIYDSKIQEALKNFQGLPHRLQFLRELNNIKYYDDNFSTNLSSTKVAINAFPNTPLVLIAGGRDKTNNADLPDLAKLLQESKNIQKVILIGESGHALAKILPEDSYVVCESLSNAINVARHYGESLHGNAVVLMSPAAASFDMFENVYDRGAKFQKYVQELK